RATGPPTLSARRSTRWSPLPRLPAPPRWQPARASGALAPVAPLLQPDLVAADELRVTGEGRVDLRRGQPVTCQGIAVPGLGLAPGGLAGLPALGARPGLVVEDPAEVPVDLRHGP